MTLRSKKKLPPLAATAPSRDGHAGELGPQRAQAGPSSGSGAEGPETPLQFLHRATGALFSGHASEQERLGALVQLCVPYAADWCIVDLLDSPSEMVRVAVKHRDPDRGDEAQRLLGRFSVDPDRGAPGGLALQRRATQVWPAQAGSTGFPTPFGRARACVSVPLLAGERALGVATFALTGTRRGYGADDVRLLEDLCAQAAMAVDHARLLDQKESAQLAQEDLLAIVSHDMRNPLGLIMMSSKLLMNPSIDTAATQKNAARIDRAALQIERLIRDLLDLAVIESGRFVVERQPHSVSRLIGEALEAMTPLASNQGLDLSARGGGSAGLDLVVSCDRARTLQVLSNLIGNAIKFTTKGGVTIGADSLGAEVQFSVDDTGPGIPPDQLPLVFARDWRASPTVQQGIGLELSIAKGIVSAHRGRIWIESQLEKGTSVRFTLPTA